MSTGQSGALLSLNWSRISLRRKVRAIVFEQLDNERFSVIKTFEKHKTTDKPKGLSDLGQLSSSVLIKDHCNVFSQHLL